MNVVRPLLKIITHCRDTFSVTRYYILIEPGGALVVIMNETWNKGLPFPSWYLMEGTPSRALVESRINFRCFEWRRFREGTTSKAVDRDWVEVVRIFKDINSGELPWLPKLKRQREGIVLLKQIRFPAVQDPHSQMGIATAEEAVKQRERRLEIFQPLFLPASGPPSRTSH